MFTTEVVLNPFAGQMVILSGAKSLDSQNVGGDTSAPAAAQREEVQTTPLDDEIPF